MRLEIFLQVNNRFDLRAHSFLVEGLAMLVMRQVLPHAHNFDVSFRQFPKLIFFQYVNVFRSFRNLQL